MKDTRANVFLKVETLILSYSKEVISTHHVVNSTLRGFFMPIWHIVMKIIVKKFGYLK